MREKSRPSHADYTYQAKFGLRDHRGGGRSSARETVGRVAAGAIAKKLLWAGGEVGAGQAVSGGVEIRAFLTQVHDIVDALSRGRISPAHYGNSPVAVNLVWLLASTTVRGKT